MEDEYMPKKMLCDQCGGNLLKGWMWLNGIRIYECQTCKNMFTEKEAQLQ